MHVERGKVVSFLNALFDFSFTEFVTPKIVKFIYILSMIIVGLGYISSLIGGFAQGVGAGIAALIVGAIVAILVLAYIRVVLEFFMVLFRIYENTHTMANQGYPGGSTPPSSAYQPAGPPPGMPGGNPYREP